jgi:hypothetical protein
LSSPTPKHHTHFYLKEKKEKRMVKKAQKKKGKKKRKWKENQFIVLNFAQLLNFLSLFWSQIQ